MKTSRMISAMRLVLLGLFLFAGMQSELFAQSGQFGMLKKLNLSFSCPNTILTEAKATPAEWKFEGGWNAFLTALVIAVPKNTNGTITYDWKESAFWDGKGEAPKIMCQYGGNVFGGMSTLWLTRPIPAGYRCTVKNLQPNRIPIVSSIDCALFNPPRVK